MSEQIESVDVLALYHRVAGALLRSRSEHEVERLFLQLVGPHADEIDHRDLALLERLKALRLSTLQY